MKTITAEFAIPDVVRRGKYAGARVVDVPTEDLGFLFHEHRRAPRLARAIDFELRRRKKSRSRNRFQKSQPPLYPFPFVYLANRYVTSAP